MMHFFKLFPLLPLIPALAVFGFGTFLLYYGKKESSPCLKWGGYVASIGAAFIILLLVLFMAKKVIYHGEHNEMMGPGGCPMMEGMKGGEMGGKMGGMPGMPAQPQGCNCPTKCGSMHKK
jgi:hypothetical protein